MTKVVMVTALRTRPCRLCGRPVVWALTDNGRRMPVDAQPVAPDVLAFLVLWFYSEEEPHPQQRVSYTRNPRYTGPRWISHWATCPDRSVARQLAAEDAADSPQLDLFEGRE